MLFYHLNLHCYVVVEVKIKEFKSRDIGQIGTYINIVDDIVKMDSDGKTIGLIICKEKNNVLIRLIEVMKKVKWILFSFLLIGGSLLLQSCLDDDDNNDYNSLAITTIKVKAGQDYYFALDDGKKMLPGDTTSIHNYLVKDGQRAFVYFNLLEEKKEKPVFLFISTTFKSSKKGFSLDLFEIVQRTLNSFESSLEQFCI